MRVVLIGPPGSGKGTQAHLLSQRLLVPHISTGGFLRDLVQKQTQQGQNLDKLLREGTFVSDELLISWVQDRLTQKDIRWGFILDGFPRNLAQAQSLEQILACNGLRLDAVIELEIGPEEVIDRLSGRRVCPSCHQVFHIKYVRSLDGKHCDDCGAELIQRPDDSPSVIEDRLRLYYEQTRPVIYYYAEKGFLRTVNARYGIERTFELICQALGLTE